MPTPIPKLALDILNGGRGGLGLSN